MLSLSKCSLFHLTTGELSSGELSTGQLSTGQLSVLNSGGMFGRTTCTGRVLFHVTYVQQSTWQDTSVACDNSHPSLSH